MARLRIGSVRISGEYASCCMTTNAVARHFENASCLRMDSACARVISEIPVNYSIDHRNLPHASNNTIMSNFYPAPEVITASVFSTVSKKLWSEKVTDWIPGERPLPTNLSSNTDTDEQGPVSLPQSSWKDRLQTQTVTYSWWTWDRVAFFDVGSRVGSGIWSSTTTGNPMA